jgi:hypothetical protein
MEYIEKLLLTKYALSAIATFFGSAALILSIWGLSHQETYRQFLKQMPRNQTWARWLLLINVIWSAPLTANFLQSMEFPPWTRPLTYYILAPGVFILVIFKVHQYMGARMLGWLMILMAKPVLYACLVRDEPSKFLLVFIAYYWIIAGMVVIAAPHFLRDWITFYLDKPGRLQRSLKFKGVVGAALIAMGLFVY